LGTTLLQELCLALYNIVHHKGDTLAKVMESNPPSVILRRDLGMEQIATSVSFRPIVILGR
jgi:hypothetical protein